MFDFTECDSILKLVSISITGLFNIEEAVSMMWLRPLFFIRDFKIVDVLLIIFISSRRYS